MADELRTQIVLHISFILLGLSIIASFLDFHATGVILLGCGFGLAYYGLQKRKIR